MKRILTIIIAQVATCCVCLAQQPLEIDLWPGGAPESNGLSRTEKGDDYSFARLYVYRAATPGSARATVIICPGGGYSGLAMTHEGHDYARWLNAQGITAVILKYRMPNRHHEIPLKDAQRTIRLVRSKAAEWNINPACVGISGFSAGGHLASTAATHFDAGNVAADPIDRLSCRPDFAILFYPVITMREEFTHHGSRRNLLGDGYNADLISRYSNETQVTPQTPPTFLITSDDDRGVPPRNSTEFYLALNRNGVPAVLHIIPDGGHGWGTHPDKPQFADWSVPLKAWLAKTLK